MWEYFERVTPYDARCLVCGRVFRQGVSGNTTNLRVHLHTHDVYVRPLPPGGLGAAGGGRSSLPPGHQQLIQIQIEDIQQRPETSGERHSRTGI